MVKMNLMLFMKHRTRLEAQQPPEVWHMVRKLFLPKWDLDFIRWVLWRKLLVPPHANGPPMPMEPPLRTKRHGPPSQWTPLSKEESCPPAPRIFHQIVHELPWANNLHTTHTSMTFSQREARCRMVPKARHSAQNTKPDIPPTLPHHLQVSKRTSTPTQNCCVPITCHCRPKKLCALPTQYPLG